MVFTKEHGYKNFAQNKLGLRLASCHFFIIIFLASLRNSILSERKFIKIMKI